MNHSDWTAIFEFKIKGTCNLHNALINQSLDFFLIATSLFTFSGSSGQADYSTSNALLSAFCQYRHDLGLPASILKVCPVDGVGLSAENSQLQKRMKAQAFHFLNEQAFLDFVELSLLNACPAASNAPLDPCPVWKNPCEIFVGLESELKSDDCKTEQAGAETAGWPCFTTSRNSMMQSVCSTQAI